MTRPASILALLFLFASSAQADHHKDWLKFFEGNWVYVESHGGESGEGTLTGKLVSNGNAVVAEFMSKAGPAIEIIGYRPESNRLVSNGYGPDGAYYQHDFTTVDEKKLAGTTRGITADGSSYEGTIEIEMRSPDEFRWVVSTKNAAGDGFEASGTVTRKSSSSQAAQDWCKYFEGKWKYEESVGGATDSGTAEYMLEGTGAMIVRFKGGAGNSTELLGWKDDEQVLSCAGHGAANVGYWRHELTVTPDLAIGPSYGMLGDGRKYEGTMTVKKFDADHWEWRFTGKTDDGEEFEGVGKFTRE